VIVVDTSVIVAYMNAGDGHHAEVSSWLDDESDELVTTPLVIAEADHLVMTRGGSSAAERSASTSPPAPIWSSGGPMRSRPPPPSPTGTPTRTWG